MIRLSAVFLLFLATLAPAATGTLTWGPGDSCTVSCTGGTTPPATITCPDGSTHPAGYVCPAPPANVTCPDGSVHPPGYACPSPPVEGPWNGTCPGFNRTLAMSFNFQNPTRAYTQSFGGFGGNDVIVAQFTTGSTPTPNNNLARIAAAEYGASPTTREAVLSLRPCDFSAQAFAGASTSGTSVTVPFTVINTNNFGYYPILLSNTTYYYNIKNSKALDCAGVSCDMAVDLTNTPKGVSALAAVAPSTAAITKALSAPTSGYAAAAKAALAKKAKAAK